MIARSRCKERTRNKSGTNGDTGNAERMKRRVVGGVYRGASARIRPEIRLSQSLGHSIVYDSYVTIYTGMSGRDSEAPNTVHLH